MSGKEQKLHAPLLCQVLYTCIESDGSTHTVRCDGAAEVTVTRFPSREFGPFSIWDEVRLCAHHDSVYKKFGKWVPAE